MVCHLLKWSTTLRYRAKAAHKHTNTGKLFISSTKWCKGLKMNCELTVMNMSKWRRGRRKGQKTYDRSALQIAPFQAKLRHVVHRSIPHREGLKLSSRMFTTKPANDLWATQDLSVPIRINFSVNCGLISELILLRHRRVPCCQCR